MQALLEKKVDLNGLVKGMSALHKAAIHHKLKSIKWLVEHKADIEIKTASPAQAGLTPLHSAAKAYYQSDQTVKTLLELGADVHATVNIEGTDQSVLDFAEEANIQNQGNEAVVAAIRGWGKTQSEPAKQEFHSKLSKVLYKVGDKVECNWESDNIWYAATVIEVVEDGQKLKVKYDADSKEETISLDHVRSCVQEEKDESTQKKKKGHKGGKGCALCVVQ